MPQRPDDGSWPVPKDELLVQKFSTEALEGDWYISAGYLILTPTLQPYRNPNP